MLRWTWKCQPASGLALYRYIPSKKNQKNQNQTHKVPHCQTDLQATQRYYSSTISMQQLTNKSQKTLCQHTTEKCGWNKRSQTNSEIYKSVGRTYMLKLELTTTWKNHLLLTALPMNNQKASMQHPCSLFLMSAYKYCKATMILYFFQGNLLSFWKANVFCTYLWLWMDLWLSNNPSGF